MVHNLECEKARALYSLMLDEMAEADEIAYVDSHLQECADCREELAQWRRISQTLQQEGREPILAPPGFTQGVMARIAQEKPQASPSTAKWSRKGIAVAAALLATIGAASIYWPNNPSTAPQVAVENPGTVTPQPGDQPYGTAADTTGNNVADTANQTPGTGTNNSDNAKVTAPGTNSPTPGNNSGSPSIVLLSNNVVIQSSLLKVNVADPLQSADQVTTLAARYEGTAHTDGVQELDGKTNVMMSLTVPTAQAPALIKAVSGLGTAVNVPQSQDITAQYQQALSRRQELLGLGQTSGNPTAYQAELQSLERQIQEWNQQASTYSIVLWLNQS